MYNPKWFTKPKAGILYNRAHPLARGLVGYWLFNEDNGNKVRDIISESNIGTFDLASRGVWTGSQMGGGMLFPTANGRLNCGATYTFRESFTMCMWLNCTSFSGADGGYIGLFNFGTASTGAGMFYQNSLHAFNKGGVVTVSSALTVPTDKWQFVVWTCNELRHPWLYLNGALAFTSTNTGNITAPTGNKTIGSSVSTGFFNGIIDEVRIYNRVLSETEIKTLYANPHADFHGSKQLLLL